MTFSHDEVIQYAHFDQGQDLFQPCRQDVIRLAGFCTPRRVVVHKNGRRSVMR